MRTTVGDIEFLEAYGCQCELSELQDENGFNLLFYCAASGLGRADQTVKARLTRTCRFLLDCGVNSVHEVQADLPILPAFL
jgi:hypothetical protein